MSEALKFQVRRRVFMAVTCRSLINNSFCRPPVLPLRSCSKSFWDKEMHAWAASSSGTKKNTSLRSSREANKLQVRNKMVARRERGLSQLDYSDSESNCHRHPLGNPSPSDGIITLRLHPWAITPSSDSRLTMGCLCQLDPSSGDLTDT